MVWRGLLLLVLILVLATPWASQRWIESYWSQPLLITEASILEVEPGTSLTRLSRRLEADYGLQCARCLVWLARYEDKTAIRAGQYQLRSAMSVRQLLDKLLLGEVVQYQVTLLEGWTFRQALNQLHRQDSLQSSLEGLSSEQALQALNLDIDHPEGWFFPDTYQYEAGATDVDLLLRAHRRMQAEVAQAWADKADNLPYQDAYEALIMASIIERETGVPSEREQIAGVFVRRLRKGMRLQTDPTVIYGLGEHYQGNLTRKHLRQKTPYNTYVIGGLPPTPIALVGRAALRAAVNPAPGKSLYFVAKGDGSHYFSATLKEHNTAVRRYQLQRKKNYRSAPSLAP